ncbi:MAG: 2-oxo acid dehydrogenase subunit E2 [Propionicimonas sp.]|uniref:2-oxo acid dehydrogenase subunit E2 n=1 Tax=Propionicimonas sp. TaxID=1955623 RepID=UPI002B1EE2BF|nr:2-oxo acid dehydrogenase subunit E2 [Propionicimonas sp.]MEA4944415.1 2-oxo acid dehydrogenase subunit E2 [Propionicimonas sp.]MEA5052053.1 2-oxo acid dehydrogenase subunit E2 [Propionicimonas sp.]
MTRTARRRGDRHDATRVDLGREFKAVFPYIMRGRNDSIAYYPIQVDAEPLLAYIEEHKGTESQLSVFEAFLLVLIRILRERPTLNRYFAGRRLYQRRNVDLSFVARRQYTDDASETNVFVSVKPEDDRATILAKIRGEIRVAKSGETKDDEDLIGLFLRLPRGLLRAAVKVVEWWDFYVDTPGFLRGVDPLRCSAYVANLGSVGMGAAYHHLFEWGTCSLFVTIGQIKPTVCVGEDGKPAVRRMVELRFALDERIADGYYDATALNLFDTYLREPAELERL